MSPHATSLLGFFAGAAVRGMVLAAAMAALLGIFRVRRAATRVFCWMSVLYGALALPFINWLAPHLVVRLPAALMPRWPGHALVPAAATVLWLYIAVALILLVRAAAGTRRLRRLLLRAAPVTEAEPLAELQARAAIAGLERAPALLESEALAVPMTAGVRRPCVLLPSNWRTWSATVRRGVLAHELAHVSRGDVLTQWVAIVYRALFWFSPLSWWLAAHLANLAEDASDEAALGAGAERADYAETLLGFFGHAARGRVRWQAMSMARGRPERRIARVLAWSGGSPVRLAEARILGLALLTAPLALLAAAVLPEAPPPAALHPTVSTQAPAIARVRPNLSPPPAARSISSASSATRPLPVVPVVQPPTAETEEDDTPASLRTLQLLPDLPPIPANPWEPVAGPVDLLRDPAARSRVLAQFAAVRTNFNLTLPGAPPFTLEAELTTAAADALPQTGSFVESWYGPYMQWSATLGGASWDQVVYNQHAWSREDVTPAPLLLQLARTALLDPVPDLGVGDLAAANVVWRGDALTCALRSGGRVPPLASGRAWQQLEFCAKNATGRLRLFSPAPGLYGVYDYGQGPVFHGHDYPSAIEFHENGGVVLRIRVRQLADAAPVDPETFRPTPDLPAQGVPKRLASFAQHYTLYVGHATAALLGPELATRVVAVHAAINPYGEVIEADALQRQDPALAQNAVNNVRRMNFGASRGTAREAIVECVYMAGDGPLR